MKKISMFFLAVLSLVVSIKLSAKIDHIANTDTQSSEYMVIPQPMIDASIKNPDIPAIVILPKTSPSGGVSKQYVDTEDQKILVEANDYTDTGLSNKADKFSNRSILDKTTASFTTAKGKEIIANSAGVITNAVLNVLNYKNINILQNTVSGLPTDDDVDSKISEALISYEKTDNLDTDIANSSAVKANTNNINSLSKKVDKKADKTDLDKYELKDDLDTDISNNPTVKSKISDAPTDNKIYGRKNNNWTEIISGGSATWGNIQGNIDDQKDLQNEFTTKIGDAPLDMKVYARRQGTWVNIETLPASWGNIIGDINTQADLQSEFSTKINDAPNDGKLYGRQSQDWEEIHSSGNPSWGNIIGDIENQGDLQKEFSNYTTLTVFIIAIIIISLVFIYVFLIFKKDNILDAENGKGTTVKINDKTLQVDTPFYHDADNLLTCDEALVLDKDDIHFVSKEMPIYNGDLSQGFTNVAENVTVPTGWNGMVNNNFIGESDTIKYDDHSTVKIYANSETISDFAQIFVPLRDDKIGAGYVFKKGTGYRLDFEMFISNGSIPSIDLCLQGDFIQNITTYVLKNDKFAKFTYNFVFNYSCDTAGISVRLGDIAGTPSSPFTFYIGQVKFYEQDDSFKKGDFTSNRAGIQTLIYQGNEIVIDNGYLKVKEN